MKTDNKANKQLSLAFFLNLFFAVIELVGGILTNSTAIIADAFHDFMDAVAIGIAVYMDYQRNRHLQRLPTAIVGLHCYRQSLCLQFYWLVQRLCCITASYS